MSQKQKHILWPILIVVGLAIGGLVLAHSPVDSPATKSAAPIWPLQPVAARQADPVKAASSSATSQQAAPTRVPGHFTTLRETGFDPVTIDWPKGKAFLVINNLTRSEPVILRLEAEHGNRLKEFTVNSERRRWSSVLDLTPGRYLVTEVNHPAWKCQIVVTPR